MYYACLDNMDNLTERQRKFCMSRIRSKDTQPEKIVRQLLTQVGWRYRLHSAKLPGKPDIVISKIKSVIFINGCFWHQHKDCKRQVMPKTNVPYWRKKLKHNIEKQKKDIKELEKAGWRVIIIWECEVKNRKQLLNKLKNELKE